MDRYHATKAEIKEYFNEMSCGGKYECALEAAITRHITKDETNLMDALDLEIIFSQLRPDYRDDCHAPRAGYAIMDAIIARRAEKLELAC